MNPASESLTDTLAQIKAGQADAHGFLDRCYDRIEARESRLGAWQHLRPRAECHDWLRANAGWLSGTPLKGLPVAVKDIIDTADMPTTLGSHLHAGRRPADDAACVAALRAAGALILGKTVTTEFAYFTPGKTANPRDLRRTPGGSSSGSAAAVADGMVPVALGSQTAASVIRPAAYCGAVGYVATRGMMSLRGIQPLAQSLDSLGMIAASCADVRLVAGLLAGPDAVQSEPLASLADSRFLLVSGRTVGDVSNEMEAAAGHVADRLASAGAVVEQLDCGDRLMRLVELHKTIMAYEAARNMAAEAGHPDQIGPAFAELVASGRAIAFRDYLAARSEVAGHAAWLAARMDGYAGLIAPAAPGSAPMGLAATGSPHMSRPWQMLGLPAVTWPAQADADGLPLGVQLIGPRWSDATVLEFAGRLALLE